MTSIPRISVSIVSLWDVFNHMGFTEAEMEAVRSYGFRNVTWGDAVYTLIGNNFALACIQDAMESYYDELNHLYYESSRNIPAHLYTREDIASMFWEVVGKDDYINLEGTY